MTVNGYFLPAWCSVHERGICCHCHEVSVCPSVAILCQKSNRLNFGVRKTWQDRWDSWKPFNTVTQIAVTAQADRPEGTRPPCDDMALVLFAVRNGCERISCLSLFYCYSLTFTKLKLINVIATLCIKLLDEFFYPRPLVQQLAVPSVVFWPITRLSCTMPLPLQALLCGYLQNGYASILSHHVLGWQRKNYIRIT